MEYPYEILQELWEITAWRDGCVYKTRYVRDVYVGFGGDEPQPREQPPFGFLFVAHRDPMASLPRRRCKESECPS